MSVQPEVYKFRHKGKTLVLDVPNSAVFETDSLGADVLTLYGRHPRDRIITQLNQRYPRRDISVALEEIDRLGGMGFLRSRPLTSNPRPRFYVMRLDAVPACTLCCRYCYTGRNGDGDTRVGVMDKAIIRRAVDFFLGEFARDAERCDIIFGQTGEPLLRLDLFDYIRDYADRRAAEYCKQVNCVITNTNGTLLTEGNISYLASLGQHPAVSIDGPKEIHDAMRCFPGGRGSYERILPLLGKAIDEGLTWASAALTGERPCVTDIFLHLFDLGFRHITIKPIRVQPGERFGINRRNIGRVKAQYRRFVDFLLAQSPSDLLCYLPAIDQNDFFGRFLRRLLLRIKILYRCPAARNDIAVDPKGDIYPCDSFVGTEEFSLGNVFTGIDQERRKRFTSLEVDRKLRCKDCWARYLCGGGCYHSAWLATGRIEDPDPVNCELVKHLIKLAMVLISELEVKEPGVLKAFLSGFNPRVWWSSPPLAKCGFTRHPPAFDGDKERWREATCFRLDREGQLIGPKIWRGKDDLSATVWTLWDHQRFYLMAEVWDDTFCPPPTVSRLPDGDSIQFAMAASPEDPGRDGSPGAINIYGAALVSGEPLMLRMRSSATGVPEEAEGAEVFIARVGDKTLYQLSVPWGDLLPLQPVAGSTFAFDFMVNERDNPRQSTARMVWAGGMLMGKLSLFGRLQLVR